MPEVIAIKDRVLRNSYRCPAVPVSTYGIRPGCFYDGLNWVVLSPDCTGVHMDANGDVITYLWDQTDGPAVVLSDPIVRLTTMIR